MKGKWQLSWTITIYHDFLEIICEKYLLAKTKEIIIIAKKTVKASFEFLILSEYIYIKGSTVWDSLLLGLKLHNNALIVVTSTKQTIPLQSFALSSFFILKRMHFINVTDAIYKITFEKY